MKARPYREYLEAQHRFAEAALTGLLASSTDSPALDPELVARAAWRLAGAMVDLSPIAYSVTPDLEFLP